MWIDWGKELINLDYVKRVYIEEDHPRVVRYCYTETVTFSIVGRSWSLKIKVTDEEKENIKKLKNFLIWQPKSFDYLFKSSKGHGVIAIISIILWTIFFHLCIKNF